MSPLTLIDVEGRGNFVATCPICGTDFESPLPNRLCDRCAAEVVARDVYQPADLRFVGILAGVLAAAAFSIPGVFLGHYIGGLFGQAWNGCLAGMIGKKIMMRAWTEVNMLYMLLPASSAASPLTP